MSARSMAALLALSLAAVLVAAPGAVAQEEEKKQEAEREKPEQVTVQLSAKNESAITGTAVLTDASTEADPHAKAVKLELSGLTAGATYPAHIHRGSCEEGGGVAVALTSVEATGEGIGSSQTAISADQLAMKEPAPEAEEKIEAEEAEEAEYAEAGREKKAMPALFIQVHGADGTPVACGDIPMKHGKHGKHDEGGAS